MSARAIIFDRRDLDEDLHRAAADYERRFDTRFTRLVFFDAAHLAGLHAVGTPPPTVRQASVEDPEIVGELAVATEVANLNAPSAADRTRYLESLESIFARLAVSPSSASATAGLVIAPQREGRILAERLGCLPAGIPAWTPQAKRISVRGGLLVGLDAPPPASTTGPVVIIDGVVASGVTLMAALELAATPGNSVEIFSAHSTPAGALALSRYAEQAAIDVTLHVGHLSGVLNERFYAVEAEDPGRLVLGDVGDTISDLVQPAEASR